MRIRDLLKLGMTSEEAKLVSGVHTLLRSDSTTRSATTDLLTSSGMSRRSAIGLLFSAGIATTLDVEQLLWTPKPIVLVPSVGVGQLVASMWESVIVDKIEELFDRDAHFFKMHLRNPKTGQTIINNMRVDGMIYDTEYVVFDPIKAMPSDPWIGREVLIKMEHKKRS